MLKDTFIEFKGDYFSKGTLVFTLIVFVIALMVGSSVLESLFTISVCIPLGMYLGALARNCKKHYIKRKKEELDHKLSDPSGMKWEIRTTDDAFIGTISETNYLKSVYEEEICFKTKAMQTLNSIWCLFMTLTKALQAVPVAMVVLVAWSAYFVEPSSFESITLGQLLSSKSFTSILSIVFMLVLMVNLMVATGKGNIFANLPGYKNYGEIKLRKILSEHVPNIANANGFKVVGIKIDLDRNIANCDLKEIPAS